jgi:hypothetical protein
MQGGDYTCEPGTIEDFFANCCTGRQLHWFRQRGGGDDRNLWSAMEIREKIGYIHDNPVRRGLVSQAEDRTWSSFRAWETGEDDPYSYRPE